LVKEGIDRTPFFKRILVALDGSIKSECVLPYAREFAKLFDCELVLLSVPEVPEVKDYRAASDIVEKLRHIAELNMQKLLDAIARSLREDKIIVRTVVSGNRPALTIVNYADTVNADLIMITTRGRGGMDLFMMGSVAYRVVENSDKPVMLVPTHHANLFSHQS